MDIFAIPKSPRAAIDPFSEGEMSMNIDVMSEMHPDSGEQYCICRSTDCTRFMIGCDKCNEWYHGDCIGVTSEDSRYIKRFYCHICREKNPSLQIVHKSKKSREKTKSESHDERPPKHSGEEKHHKKSSEKKHSGEKKEKKHGEQKKKHKHKDKDKDNDKDDVYFPSSSGFGFSHKKKKSSRKCGTCDACHKTEDCGKCDYCKDMRKYGGPNKIRQKCRQRQCLNYGLRPKTSVDDNDSNLRKMGLTPENKKVDRKRTYTETEDTAFMDIMTSFPDEYEFNENVIDPQMALEPVLNKSLDAGHTSPARKKAKVKDKGSKSKKDKSKHKSDKDKKKAKKKNKPKTKHRQENEALDPAVSDVTSELDPKQCFGPLCIQRARSSSKYCSDECGLKLATSRIFEILPQRIQQWQAAPCVAEEKNKRELEKIRKDQLHARKSLEELDLRHQELDQLIETCKREPIATDPNYCEDDPLDNELNVYCVTCGHEVKQRSALVHMVKCFAKYESQTSFGSIYKTRIEGNSMFCDYYNHAQETYCKRLKVLCPEHTKDAKVLPDEVCGFPLVSGIFNETGEFCRLAKRKCNKHVQWEKLRRAQIDMERVRQWMKVDELFEEERNIRTALADRAGLLGLMLHQTIDHNPHIPMVGPMGGET